MDPKTAAFRQILRKLQSICTSRKRIPTSHVLPLSRLNINKNHIASGGFSDVFQGTYDDLGVCVKRLRVSSTGSPGNVAMVRTRNRSIAYCHLTTPNRCYTKRL